MKLLILIGFFSLLLSCNFSQQKDVATISTLPSFKMLLMDSTTLLSPNTIPEGKPIVLLYFRPNCPHCQAETQLFIKNMTALKEVNIYMMAGVALNDIRDYSNFYQLSQYKNITVGKDFDHSFTRMFHPKAVPYMAIYNKQKNLVKIYYGEVDINAIMTAINA